MCLGVATFFSLVIKTLRQSQQDIRTNKRLTDEASEQINEHTQYSIATTNSVYCGENEYMNSVQTYTYSHKRTEAMGVFIANLSYTHVHSIPFVTLRDVTLRIEGVDQLRSAQLLHSLTVLCARIQFQPQYCISVWFCLWTIYYLCFIDIFLTDLPLYPCDEAKKNSKLIELWLISIDYENNELENGILNFIFQPTSKPANEPTI